MPEDRSNSSPLAHFALLPVVLFLITTSRTLVGQATYPALEQSGFDMVEVGTWYKTSYLVGLVALVPGAAVAVASPHLGAVLGSLVALLGIGVAATLPSSVAPGLVLTMFGTGLARPGLWSTAVQRLPELPTARAAWMVALYLVVELASLPSSLVWMWLPIESFPVSPVLAAAAVPLVLAGMLMGGLALVARTEEPYQRPLAEHGPLLGFAAATMLALIAYTGLQSLGWSSYYQVTSASGSNLGSYAMLAGQVAGVVLGACMAVALAVAHFVRVRLPDLVPFGLVLLAGSGGILASHPAVVGVVGTSGAEISWVSASLVGVLAYPIGLSRIGGGMHARLTPLLIGGWFLVAGLHGQVLDVAQPWVPLEVLLPIYALATAVTGLGLAMAAWVFRDVLLPPLEELE